MFTCRKVLTLALSVAAIGMFNTSASAWEGKVVSCYNKNYVAPKYSTRKELIKSKKYAWEHKGSQVAYVKYPAVYVERRKMVADEHYVLRQAKCK